PLQRPCFPTRRSSGLALSNQMRFDLVDGLERNAHHDQQRRSSELKWQAKCRRDDGGHHANHSEVDRAPNSDSRYYTIDILGGLRSEEHTSELQSRENI